MCCCISVFSDYEDAMILKLFVFQFINSYASFFFLAFIASSLARPSGESDDMTGQCGAPNCMQPLSINLAIIFGTRLTLTNFLDIFIPYVTKERKFKSETDGIDASKFPPREGLHVDAIQLFVNGHSELCRHSHSVRIFYVVCYRSSVRIILFAHQ
jgi:hypothetical protein